MNEEDAGSGARCCFVIFDALWSSIYQKPALAASTKFYTAANPIPNRYIVVLATTDLSPIATPAATPVSGKASAASVSTMSAMALDSSSMAVIAEPAPDPGVVATATSLTSTYGGTFSDNMGRSAQGLSPELYSGAGDSDERRLARRIYRRGWRGRGGNARHGSRLS